MTSLTRSPVYLPDALRQGCLVRDDAPQQRHRPGVDLSILGHSGKVLSGLGFVEEEDEEEEGVGHVDIVWCDVLAGPSVTAVTCDGVLCLPVMSLPALQLPVR